MPYTGHGSCAPCGKQAFASRADARHAARISVDHPRPRAYRCPVVAGQYHLGHLPADVRRGTLDRDTYQSRVNPFTARGADADAARRNQWEQP